MYAAAAPVVTPHLAVAPVVHSAPSAYVEASGLKTQYHTQDGYGQASYGHSEPHQSHNAVQVSKNFVRTFCRTEFVY